MTTTRKQLTLFATGEVKSIEYVRATFNPEQAGLIAAHVTLCREDEIGLLDQVIRNLRRISYPQPIWISFKSIERFENGKGVLLQAADRNTEFDQLRIQILENTGIVPRKHLPHITLMHPRNSTCTDKLFDQIRQIPFPSQLAFEKISLIEQKDQGKWSILEEYPILHM